MKLPMLYLLHVMVEGSLVATPHADDEERQKSIALLPKGQAYWKTDR